MKNNNLIVFLQDGTKHVLSFSHETDEQQALSLYDTMNPASKGLVKKYFYIKDDTIPTSEYQENYELSEDGKLTLDIRKTFIIKSAREAIKKRDFFLQNLDLPFMRAVEDEDHELRKYIRTIKKFLRDLPQNLRYKEIEDDLNLMKYDPFGNIFAIQLVEEGGGYTSPPNVVIDSPKGQLFGFNAKAVALVEDGKVKKIHVTDHGSGYHYAPSVTIDPPEEGEQALAANGIPQNLTLTNQEVIKNTEVVYNQTLPGVP